MVSWNLATWNLNLPIWFSVILWVIWSDYRNLFHLPAKSLLKYLPERSARRLAVLNCWNQRLDFGWFINSLLFQRQWSRPGVHRQQDRAGHGKSKEQGRRRNIEKGVIGPEVSASYCITFDLPCQFKKASVISAAEGLLYLLFYNYTCIIKPQPGKQSTFQTVRLS